MKPQFFNYSRYLISVQFDKRFLPDSISGKKDLCVAFLDTLGVLAIENGHRLHATYSVVCGKTGHHAHFAVSWLPTSLPKFDYEAWSKFSRIQRDIVIELLLQSLFFVDNPIECIKKVTKNRKYVTDYVLSQPKHMQSVEFSSEYIYGFFEYEHSKEKTELYCSSSQIVQPQNSIKTEQKSLIKKLILISFAIILMISLILLAYILIYQ